MSEVFNYLLALVVGLLEYPAWTIRYVVEHFLGQCVAVFAITFVLQKMRCSMRWDRYGRLWKILFVVGLLWGGIALVMYIPNFVKWYKEYFFLPCVLLGAGLAKLYLEIGAKAYLILLGIVIGVIALSYAIMHPYYGPNNKYNKDNNPWAIDGMFEIYKRLTDQPNSEHEGGGGGGGMLGILGGSGKADWNWGIFYSHGILLLAGVIAVPPRRRCYNVLDLRGRNGQEKAPSNADNSS